GRAAPSTIRAATCSAIRPTGSAAARCPTPWPPTATTGVPTAWSSAAWNRVVGPASSNRNPGGRKSPASFSRVRFGGLCRRRLKQRHRVAGRERVLQRLVELSIGLLRFREAGLLRTGLGAGPGL